MCGRFSLKTPVPDLAQLFEAEATGLEDWPARFNVAPTDDVVVLRTAPGLRELTPIRWGLIPSWAQDPSTLPLMINARAESIEVRRAFRDLLPERRCAVLADGFFEWRKEHGQKQPYFVRHRDSSPMCFAGLWDVWEGPDGPVPSCTIVTTDANELLDPLHDRMPVILDDESGQMWLATELSEHTTDVLKAAPAERFEVYPVDRRVNRVIADDPDCIEPIGDRLRDREGWADRPQEGDAPETQLGFF